MRYDWVVPGVHGLRDYLDLPQLPGDRSDFPLQRKETHSTPLAVTVSLLQDESTSQSPAMRPEQHYPPANARRDISALSQVRRLCSRMGLESLPGAQ
jgi:hypothetical protein